MYQPKVVALSAPITNQALSELTRQSVFCYIKYPFFPIPRALLRAGRYAKVLARV